MITQEQVIASLQKWRDAILLEDALYPCHYAELALEIAYYEYHILTRAYHMQTVPKLLIGAGWNGYYEQHTKPATLSSKVRKFVEGGKV